MPHLLAPHTDPRAAPGPGTELGWQRGAGRGQGWRTVMMSEMPRTPCLSTSSAILNASLMGTLESMAARQQRKRAQRAPVLLLLARLGQPLLRTTSRGVPRRLATPPS